MTKHYWKTTAPEQWRDIPGFGGKYQASTEGNIRRVQPNGETVPVRPYLRTGRRSHSQNAILRVHLSLPDGKRVERTVIKLVAETFLRIPEGKYAVHRNGLHTDPSVRNIIFLTPEELGKQYGDLSARRPVVKIDSNGNAVAHFTSARAAARTDHMSHMTVMSRCNGKVKREFALTGYSYRWDD